MLFLVIIILFVNIQILIAIHYTTTSSTKLNANIILGLSIPYEYQKDERIAVICNALKKRCRSIFIIGVFLNVFIIFVYQYISFTMTFVFIYFIVINYSYNQVLNTHVKQLKELKVKNNWYTNNKNILSIDTELSRLKDTFVLSRFYFLVPLVIFVMIALYFNNFIFNLYFIAIYIWL